MVNAEPQQIITSDKLNASENAQVYFEAKSNEDNVENSQYCVFDYKYQIVNLARTTLRAIISDAVSILIFGPGEAKGELKKRLEREKIGGRIVGIETVDKMTDHQIVAKVRHRFLK